MPDVSLGCTPIGHPVCSRCASDTPRCRGQLPVAWACRGKPFRLMWRTIMTISNKELKWKWTSLRKSPD